MAIQKLTSFYLNSIKRGQETHRSEVNIEKATDAMMDGSARKLPDFGKFGVWRTQDMFFCSFDNSVVGFLERSGTTAVLSFVLPRFKGLGIGYHLYEVAIEELGVLTSSTSLSIGATKLWQTLCLKYRGKVRLGKLTVPIVGFETRRGIPFPKVKNQSGDIVVLDTEDLQHLSTEEDLARDNYVYEVHCF